MKIIGTTTVTDSNKIVLISKVAQKFEVKKGDIIVFYEADNGDIIIKKG